MVCHYIYIKFRIELVLNSSVFAPNNLLATKLKKLDGTCDAKLNSNLEI